jgi:quinol monooxygenase YgiN
MIVLIVHFTVKPGAEEKAKENIRRLQENTRGEPGCRFYVGQQSHENPRRFCFYEQYDNEAALEVHRAAPYFSQYVTHGLAPLIEVRTQEFFTAVE